jgi:two-component system, chemotaxis family, sensor kinase Cph1
VPFSHLNDLTREQLLTRLAELERSTRSERKESEERFHTTEAELKDIKAALDEHSIVAITDGAGRITYINDKFCAISQYTRNELIGQDHRIINSRYHPKEFFHDLWTTIAHGRVWHGEIRNRAKDGTYYWVDTTIYPRLGDSGKPVQYVAIRTDITKRKADEENLKQFARELEEKNKELETIVYTVSHDLRSPLVNVQGFSKQLSRACDKVMTAASTTPEGKVSIADLKPQFEGAIPQALKFINAGVNKMEMLLAGLLRYSRLGRVTLNIRPLDMNALMAEIVAAMRFQIENSHTIIRVSALPGCLGDPAQTNQVFANLIDNAIKYRDPARTPEITIAGHVEHGEAIFSVADNGIGIAPQHQAKAFEIFHRLNPDTSSGEGLGLTIAQRVLERQRGRIWVESQEGKGATFFVSLPATETQSPALS